MEFYKQTDIYVFLGPTLPVLEAKNILPHANYVSPAQCGDILKLVRLNPKIIVIIDGLFESVASIWHKEILYAIQKGILVFGASSMGALRASELAEFGMIGIGKIYEQYKNSEITDDDEVAISHLSEIDHYRPITLAMVDVRATFDAALKKHIIDDVTYKSMIHIAKNIHYTQRTWQSIMKVALEIIDKSICDKFLNNLKDNGFVSQKKIDAIELLNTIHALPSQPRTYKHSFNFANSIFFEVLKKECMTSCMRKYYYWLPHTEKLLYFARFLSNEYYLLKQAAQLLPLVQYRKFNAIECKYSKTVHYFMVSLNYYDKDKLEGKNCIDRVEKFLATNSLVTRLLNILAKLWDEIQLKIATEDIYLELEDYKRANIIFRKLHNLANDEDFEHWLLNNDLSLETYYEYLNFTIKKRLINNIEIQLALNDVKGDDTFWLFEVAKMSGALKFIEEVLLNDEFFSKYSDNFDIQMKSLKTNSIIDLDDNSDEIEKFIKEVHAFKDEIRSTHKIESYYMLLVIMTPAI